VLPDVLELVEMVDGRVGERVGAVDTDDRRALDEVRVDDDAQDGQRNRDRGLRVGLFLRSVFDFGLSSEKHTGLKSESSKCVDTVETRGVSDLSFEGNAHRLDKSLDLSAVSVVDDSG